MKKLILTFLMVMVCGVAGAVQRYIDTTCQYNGDGTATSCAGITADPGAYNTFAGIGWAASSTYSMKAGTTYNGAISANQGSVTFNSYGVGAKPIINNTGSDFAIFTNQNSLIIDGLDIRSTNHHGIYMNPSFQSMSGLQIKNSTIAIDGGDNDVSAIYVYMNTASRNIASVTITNNDISMTGGNAAINFEQTNAGSYPYDVTITYNTIHDMTGYSTGINGRGIRFHGTIAGAGVGNTSPYGINVSYNTLTNINSSCISFENGLKDVAAHPNYIGYNSCTNIGATDSPSVNAYQFNWVNNATIENNYCEDVYCKSGFCDGDCFIMDYAWADTDYQSDNNVLRYNKATGASTTNSNGFNVWRATNTTLHHNLSYGNYNGFNVNGALSTGNAFYNNIAYDNAGSGLKVDNSAAASTWKNNISFGNTLSFGRNPNATLPTETNNCIDGTASITLDATDVSGDPLFVDAPNGDFHLQYTSPCRGIGVDVGLTVDAAGVPVAFDAGIYQTTGVRW
jgi:hypothetical protein